MLIRIRGASSGVFDQTFFKYQVSEQTRLRQITTELFIRKGLDAALNIDRESFNFSHPHVQFVALWLHRAIRQLTNRHKDISKKEREQKREVLALANRDSITQYSESVWDSLRSNDVSPDIVIEKDRGGAEAKRALGYMALARDDMPTLAAAMQSPGREDREVQVRALMRVLAAYEVLDGRPYDEQQALIEAILRIFLSASDK